VLTVHNLAYQGLFPKDQWPLTGLPEAAFTINGLEFYGQVNCLKGALVSADGLTTVSPTYSREIQTSAFGCGLDGVLRARTEDLAGIVNGIDPNEWNPKTDPHLPARFGPEELAGKAVCKLQLQQRSGLAEHHGLLIGMIQRLTEQKGLDLFLEGAPRLLALPLQLIILGTGEPSYHEQLQQLAKRFPDRLAVHLTFDEALAHQIEAGADAFLMPSRFEPCGLNQLYSLRYGTVPIVRRIGGLADTVVDVSPARLADGTATGFVFEPYTAAALLEAVQRAVAAFAQPDLWGRLVQHGMSQDHSWTRSAQEYVRLYERVRRSRRDSHRHPQSLAG
jgi:starch synthase